MPIIAVYFDCISEIGKKKVNPVAANVILGNEGNSNSQQRIMYEPFNAGWTVGSMKTFLRAKTGSLFNCRRCCKVNGAAVSACCFDLESSFPFAATLAAAALFAIVTMYCLEIVTAYHARLCNTFSTSNTATLMGAKLTDTAISPFKWLATANAEDRRDSLCGSIALLAKTRTELRSVLERFLYLIVATAFLARLGDAVRKKNAVKASAALVSAQALSLVFCNKVVAALRACLFVISASLELSPTLSTAKLFSGVGRCELFIAGMAAHQFHKKSLLTWERLTFLSVGHSASVIRAGRPFGRTAIAPSLAV